MQGSFTSHTYNITALLGRTSFPNYGARPVIVPPFQRAYSWEKIHVSTFWEDVSEFHKQRERQGAHSTYFFGPIVIMPEDGQVTLLDGQQRLATTTILLASIRDIARIKGGQPGSDLARDIHRDLIMVDDDQGTYAIGLGELDTQYFKANIQEDPPSESITAKLRSHRLIKQARSFLYNQIESLVDGRNSRDIVETLKLLRNTVSSHLMMVAIEVRSEEEAFLIFETLNDRGLRLSVPDLVLNHLMRNATNQTDRNSIRHSWNSITENLGQRQISTFIRHMWVSRFGDVKTQGLFREIRDNLTKNDMDSLEFANICAEESALYTAIVSIDEKVIGKGAVPHIQGLMRNLESDRSLPLLLSGLVCLSKADFAKSELRSSSPNPSVNADVCAGDIWPLVVIATMHQETYLRFA